MTTTTTYDFGEDGPREWAGASDADRGLWARQYLAVCDLIEATVARSEP